jgi:hypothetical protein
MLIARSPEKSDGGNRRTGAPATQRFAEFY